MFPRLIVALSLVAAMAAAAEPELKLMPWPAKVERKPGALRIDGSFRAGFTGRSSPLLERAALRMVAQLSRETGVPMTRKLAASATLTIQCADPADKPDKVGDNESYTLDVSASGAKIEAPTAKGVLRGLQTFLQLVSAGDQWFHAPAVHIEDAPRYAWRGLLMDVTSHFQPVSVIERNLDAMEAVKLNVFHWHFTDDQGFRVESKVFPKLHQLGSDGDYYSQADIRHLVAYAHDRGIRIVPEFDMPGHCATWLIGYPELGSAPGPYSIIHTFGIYDPTLDPSNEKVYAFIDKLLGEMATLFPDEYLHIGGDEVTGRHWKQNASIQAFMKSKGFKTQGDLHTYFNQRVEKIVRAHGKVMMGWDEILHPELPKDIVVQAWRDHESMATAAKRGYPTLLSFGYYLDHLKTAASYYSVDPLGGPGQSLSAAESKGILGGEACMWTEFVNPETIDSRIWPKTAAIAERFWSPREVADVASMHVRMDEISRRLDWRGTLHNRNYREMLERLAGPVAAEDLRVLADALQPLGIEDREKTQRYSQSTQLNRLVDAARGENVAARRLETRIAGWQRGQDSQPIRSVLNAWRHQQVQLLEVLNANFLLRENLPVSAGLARAAAIGLEALDLMERGATPSPDWSQRMLAELDQLAKPKVETSLAAVGPVRMLVQRAAGVH